MQKDAERKFFLVILVNFLVEHSSKVLNGEEGVGRKELFYLGRRRNTKVESVGMPLIKRIGRLIKKKFFRLKLFRLNTS